MLSYSQTMLSSRFCCDEVFPSDERWGKRCLLLRFWHIHWQSINSLSHFRTKSFFALSPSFVMRFNTGRYFLMRLLIWPCTRSAFRWEICSFAVVNRRRFPEGGQLANNYKVRLWRPICFYGELRRLGIHLPRQIRKLSRGVLLSWHREFLELWKAPLDWTARFSVCVERLQSSLRGKSISC